MTGPLFPATPARVVQAIATINDETGFPPDAEELASVLRLTTRQVHSLLLQAKRSGRVRYDENGRFVVVDDV